MISQEDFNVWYSDSIAPISSHFQLVRCSFSTIKKTYSDYITQSSKSRSYFDNQHVDWVADFDEITIGKHDLPRLLMPQNRLFGRIVFVETDSAYTAAFFPRGRYDVILSTSTYFYLSWLVENGLMVPAEGPEFFTIKAVPPSVLAEDEGSVTDGVVCPDPWFVSNGDCSLYLVDFDPQAPDLAYSVSVGHTAEPRPQFVPREDGSLREVHPDDLWTGTLFGTSSNTPFEDLPYEFADLLFSLPENIDDTGPEPTLATAAWDLFGTREMDLICDEFGIRPFDRSFYGKRALVATMRAEPCERVEAEPRIDFRSFQRWIGVGPELIWTRD